MSFIARTHPQQGPNEKVDDRETTWKAFEEISARFGPFSIDVAASDHNTKVTHNYFTKADNGLDREWRGVVWCNPPYSNIRPWVEKAWTEWSGYKCASCLDLSPGSSAWNTWCGPCKGKRIRRPERIVMLLPANRTEQAWWQDLVEPERLLGNLHVEFLRGRMRFIAAGDTEIKPNSRPPFGVCLLVWGHR